MVSLSPINIDFSVNLHDIWKTLTEGQQVYLLQHVSLFSYKRNEKIYCEGDIPSHLMCLVSGKVKIIKEGIGRSQIIRMIKPGEYFAYRAAFAQENYITGAAAFEASVVCSIPMKVIFELTYVNRDLAMFFIRQLSKDLGIADERTVSLTQKHIRARLAEALLVLKENYGLEEDGATLGIYLSREDLASLSNMTTSNAIRTLSLFAAEKLIATDGRKIKIIDEEQLIKISKIG